MLRSRLWSLYSSAVTDSTLKELVRIVWALQPVFEIGIIFFLIRRKLFIPYASFALYIILDLISFPVEFVLHSRSYLYYFWFHWPFHIALFSVSFWVLGSIFVKSFEGLPGFQHLGRILFHWGAPISFILALLFVLFAGVDQGNMMMNVLEGANELLYLTQVVLVLILFAASQYLGMSRQSLALGIALGFGFKAGLTQIPGYFWPIHRSYHSMLVKNLFEMAVYAIACMIWLQYAAAPEPAKEKVSMIPNTLQGWDLALSQLLRVPSRP